MKRILTNFRASTRQLIKRAYLAIPLKKELFLALRPHWTPPEFVRSKLYFRGNFDVDVPGGRALKLVHSCAPVETAIFWKGLLSDFERTSLGTWIKLAEGSRVIFDVGANSGVYALTARAVNLDARIVAFEPMPRIHDKLVENVVLNAAGITCERVAASNYDGPATMYDLPNSAHTYGGTVNQDLYAQHGFQAVPLRITAVRLETFIAKSALEGVDLIKIDVESHEPAVIEGLGDALLRFRPTMIVEIWNDEVGRAVEALVSKCDYRYFATDEVGPFERQTSIRQRTSGKPFTNFLLCRPEIATALGLS